MVCNKALEQALFALGLELNALKIEIKQKQNIMLFICNTIKSNSNITNNNNNNYNTIHRKCMRIWAKSYIVLYARTRIVFYAFIFLYHFRNVSYDKSTHNREAEKLSDYIV